MYSVPQAFLSSLSPPSLKTPSSVSLPPFFSFLTPFPPNGSNLDLFPPVPSVLPSLPSLTTSHYHLPPLFTLTSSCYPSLLANHIFPFLYLPLLRPTKKTIASLSPLLHTSSAIVPISCRLSLAYSHRCCSAECNSFPSDSEVYFMYPNDDNRTLEAKQNTESYTVC